MKPKITILVALIIAVAAGAMAQTQPAAPKTLAATINVYVFPNEGQTPEQQSIDEATCYDWAFQNTGTDPFDLEKQAQQQVQQTQQTQEQIAASGQGAGVKGAVGGAAAGALIGEIASNDPGRGAAYGAAAGAVVARRQTKKAKAGASQQAAQQGQQAQQATAAQIENFKKAFSVCLEGKKYMVKF